MTTERNWRRLRVEDRVQYFDGTKRDPGDYGTITMINYNKRSTQVMWARSCVVTWDTGEVDECSRYGMLNTRAAEQAGTAVFPKGARALLLEQVEDPFST